jgi:hypothetical protein
MLQCFYEGKGTSQYIGCTTDTVTTVAHAGATGSAANNTITDTAIQPQHKGIKVTGTNIPSGCYVGTVTAGASFLLVDALGNAVSPTGAVAGITLVGTGRNVQAIGNGGHVAVEWAFQNGATGAGAPDNVCAAITVGPSVTALDVIGLQVKGSDSSHRFASVFDGNTSVIRWSGVQTQNVTQPCASEGGRTFSPSSLALAPTGALGETFPRGSAESGQNVLTSGKPWLVAIWLPAGTKVSNLTFCSGTTAMVTPSHWWFALYDSARNQLAVTADQTTATWSTSTAVTLPIATTATGAATSFTTTYTGLHYLGIMVAAATVPNLIGTSSGSAEMGLPPVITGPSTDAAQTTPPAFPHVAGALSGNNLRPYAFVS